MDPEISDEAHEALTAVKLEGIKKKLNEESWSENMEQIMKMWGEKAAGLRFMHGNASGYWTGLSNNLTITSIFITTLASTASLVSTSIEGENKNIVLYVVGIVGLIASLIQSLKKFYNAEEKAAEHGAIAKQFGSFYRFMTLQLGMERSDRMPSDQLSEWALKEYERLQQDALPLGADQINLYKKTFVNSKQSVPDICEDEFIINVYGTTNNLEEDDNQISRNN
jgi:hypothetical protein